MLLPIALLLAIRLTPEAVDMPYQQPQLAASGQTVGLVFGAGTGVYFAASPDQGATFTRPVRVAQAGALSLGRHRGPRVVMTPQAIVVSAIVGNKGRGADGDVLVWRSTDGGVTWSSGVRINSVPSAAREGLHAMAAQGDSVFVTWLDLREKGTQLYGAFSTDGGRTWSANRLVYASPSGSVCECCHPTAVIDAQQRITVMFRNWHEGARDLYLAQSTDGGRTFAAAQKLGQGTWQLNACPMDGGGVAVNESGALLTTWRREKDVFVVAPGEKEVRVATGKDPSVAVGKKGPVIAWTSLSGPMVQMPGQTEPLRLDTAGGYVQLLRLPHGRTLATWESQGSIAVRLLPE